MLAQLADIYFTTQSNRETVNHALCLGCWQLNGNFDQIGHMGGFKSSELLATSLRQEMRREERI